MWGQQGRWDRECLRSTDQLERGSWQGDLGEREDTNTSARFVVPPSCGEEFIPNARFSGFLTAARAALKGRHVMLIGNEFMRYQARHLIYALHFGKWPDRFRSDKEKPGTFPSIVKKYDHANMAAFFSRLVSDIGADSIRCDCHQNIHFHDHTWYENYYSDSEKYDLRISFILMKGDGASGIHAPAGYHAPPADVNMTLDADGLIVDRDVLFVNDIESVAVGRRDSLDKVVNTLLEGLGGPVDDLVVSFDEQTPEIEPMVKKSNDPAVTSTQEYKDKIAQSRAAFMKELERLVKPGRAPIFGTTTQSSWLYHDGRINGSVVDLVDVAEEREWRILDRGGIAKVLVGGKREGERERMGHVCGNGGPRAACTW